MSEPTQGLGFIANFIANNEGTGKISMFLGGLLGGVVKLSFQKQVKIHVAWLPLLGVAVLADIGALPIAEIIGRPEYGFGSAVVIGLFGFEMVAAGHRGLANLDLAASFKQIVDAVAARITGRNSSNTNDDFEGGKK